MATTRRTILLSLSALPAGFVATKAVAQSAQPDITPIAKLDPDAALIAHAELVTRLAARAKVAWERSSDADERYMLARPDHPTYRADMPGRPEMRDCSASDLRAYIEQALANPHTVSDGLWMDQRVARLARMEAYEAECARLKRLFRVDAVNAIASRADDRLEEAARRLALIPPTTMVGLAAKARASMAVVEEGECSSMPWAHDLADIIVREVVMLGTVA